MNAASPAPRRPRVRAPELVGEGGWLNAGARSSPWPRCAAGS
ncbi:hypothetical protein [Streptomyces huiliensis]|nr:hypothetical protein [Streptomyces huiliensis]